MYTLCYFNYLDTEQNRNHFTCVCNLNIKTHRLREKHSSHQNVGVKTESVD